MSNEKYVLRFAVNDCLVEATDLRMTPYARALGDKDE